MHLAVGISEQRHLLHPRDEACQRKNRNGPEKADEETPEPCVVGTVAKQPVDSDDSMRPNQDDHQRIEDCIFGS